MFLAVLFLMSIATIITICWSQSAITSYLYRFRVKYGNFSDPPGPSHAPLLPANTPTNDSETTCVNQSCKQCKQFLAPTTMPKEQDLLHIPKGHSPNFQLKHPSGLQSLQHDINTLAKFHAQQNRQDENEHIQLQNNPSGHSRRQHLTPEVRIVKPTKIARQHQADLITPASDQLPHS